MKKHLIILLFASLLSMLTVHCFSQFAPILMEKVFTFDTATPKVIIDTSNHQNIWQIGKPNKIFFDSAYSKPYAIVTDTVNYYPSDNLSSFIIEVKKVGNNNDSCWGSAILSFWHKYDTDSLYDGGYVEIQYDSSKTWTNIIYESSPIPYATFYNNTDTILGNIPAFNGKSKKWVYSAYIFYWYGYAKKWGFHNDVKIRFVFKSSSRKVNREGWIIDDIKFSIYQCEGGVNELRNENGELSINVSPNPVNSLLVVSYSLLEKSNVNMKIYDVTGREVERIENGELRMEKGEHSIKYDVSHLKSGVYFVRLMSEEGVGVAKLIRN